MEYLPRQPSQAVSGEIDRGYVVEDLVALDGLTGEKLAPHERLRNPQWFDLCKWDAGPFRDTRFQPSLLPGRLAHFDAVVAFHQAAKEWDDEIAVLGRRDANLQPHVTFVLCPKVDQQLQEVQILINDRLAEGGGGDVPKLDGRGGREGCVGIRSAPQELTCG